MNHLFLKRVGTNEWIFWDLNAQLFSILQGSVIVIFLSDLVEHLSKILSI